MSTPSSRISGANPVYEGSELVFGLVAPVGTNLALLHNPMKRCLKEYEYELNTIRLSELSRNFDVAPAERLHGSDEYVRINEGMHAGNQLRLTSKKGEFLALAAAKRIHEGRPVDSEDRTLPRRVHVLRTLKHPDEVRALRRIYGNGFFLIGVIVGEDQRREYLKNGQNSGCEDHEIDSLLDRDQHEDDSRYVGEDKKNYGQRTRDTFQLADVFLPLGDKKELRRFISLVFGCPSETPRSDEHAMFMAFASSLRSGDLSRQVGAVVVSEAGDLVATGANDVPKAQGGLYWPGEDDRRDHVKGADSNQRQRDKIIEDVLDRLRPDEEDAEEWLRAGRKKLSSSPLMDITEYGRAVHAEMEALMSCARAGCSPRKATLFSTTFPCHNCAKHIVAAGVETVVYVEPYPKSQALGLFPDSIRLDDQDDDPELGPPGKVVFRPFKGIGPRRFFDLFSIALSSGIKLKRKAGGSAIAWKERTANVRVPLLPNSYVDREVLATKELLELTTDQERDDVDDEEQDRS